jgi:hypothetical protein
MNSRVGRFIRGLYRSLAWKFGEIGVEWCDHCGDFETRETFPCVTFAVFAKEWRFWSLDVNQLRYGETVAVHIGTSNTDMRTGPHGFKSIDIWLTDHVTKRASLHMDHGRDIACQ